MEFYDRTGNVKKINIQFEPLRSRPKPIQGNVSAWRNPVVSTACCDGCKDSLCFYLRHKEYCSDDFLGKKDCEKIQAFIERQEWLRILRT